MIMQNSRPNTKQMSVQKYLPHNFLAEKMILSCLLINTKSIEVTLKILPVDAFYFQNHQEIYRALLMMYQNKITIDILTLIAFLQDNGLLEKIGGVKVLIELLSQVPNLIYLEDYIGLVKDKFMRRSLIKLGYEIINTSYITNVPLEKILTDVETTLFEISSENKPQKLLNSSELLNDVFLTLKERALMEDFFGLKSGFDDLDSLIQGFHKSDLIIIAGRPSTGKTALGLNITMNILQNYKIPVLFFSLEMSKEQIIYRLLSMETDINQIQLRNANLSQNDWIKLNQVFKVLSKLPIYIDDTSNLSINEIRSKIKTILFEQNEIGLIVIDYLQLIGNDNSRVENRAYELSQITRSLKIIAKEFNIPVIALSQLSRNVENRVDKRPILSDLRESGSIEQDADIVLMLSQTSNQTTKNLTDQSSRTSQQIELILAKQRNGPTGSIKLSFDGDRTKFETLRN